MDFPIEFDADKFLEPVKVDGKGQPQEVIAVMTLVGPVAFRGPTSVEYARYQSVLFDQKERPKAGEILCRMCVVIPDRETFGVMITKKPGIVSTCVNPILELAGVDTEAAVKK